MSERILKKLKGRENVLLDTMLFIYLFEDDGKYANAVEKIMDMANEKIFSAIISPISAAEILVKPVRLGETAIADKYRGVLCNIPNVKNVPLNYHSKLPSIITNDKALKRLSKELDVFILDEFVQ
jgi:predicted nucleic acid-binding protein